MEWWPAVIQETKLKIDVGSHQRGSDTYNVKHTTVYRVRMMGLATQYVLREQSLLPYLAHAPANSLIAALVATLQQADAMPDFESSATFAPMPNPLKTSYASRQSSPAVNSGTTTPFEAASSFYAYALQIAGQLTGYWCATDNYEVVLPGPLEGSTYKQMRFQGLWWGPERVWVTDLVRLKPRRTQLVGDLLPSSGIAETRGLFLKISAIYLEDMKDADGTSHKAPMVAGTLYEVADPAEPAPDASREAPSTSAGRPQSFPPHLSEPSLPDPPDGFKFRAITRPTHELHLSLNMIAGRYYPHITNLTQLSNIVTTANVEEYRRCSGNPTLCEDPDMILSMRNLLGLAGLAPGATSTIEAVMWREGRSPMLNKAWKEAKEELQVFMREEMRKKQLSSEDIKMEGGEGASAPDGRNGVQMKSEAEPASAILNLPSGFSEDDAIYIDDSD